MRKPNVGRHYPKHTFHAMGKLSRYSRNSPVASLVTQSAQMQQFRTARAYSLRTATTAAGSSAVGVLTRRVRGVSRLNWRILYNSAL